MYDYTVSSMVKTAEINEDEERSWRKRFGLTFTINQGTIFKMKLNSFVIKSFKIKIKI